MWANRSVWTERMLATLETGVKGGRWHTLIDKVFAMPTLQHAAFRVVANDGAAGVDHVSAHAFKRRMDRELDQIAHRLKAGTYCPQDIRRHWIEKLGSKELRPLGIPTVADRVVQTALLSVIEPIFDREFHEHSYGFRHGRGCRHALEHVEKLLDQGHTWVVDADLKSYFDTIPHDKLLDRVREKISDGRVLSLIEQFLHQGVLEELKQWTPEAGTPQGAVISPLLANLYLNPLDHTLAAAGFEMVRYADDFVILCRSREEAEHALALVQQWTADQRLTLHPTKTKIVDAGSDGFDFLGYTFRGRLRLPRGKSLDKFRSTLRAKTKRTRSDSLQRITGELNQTLRGWFQYFRYSWPTVFVAQDQYLRGRLRSLLRKRSKRRGVAKGADHQRWPNAFFHDLGLLSLAAEHGTFSQSCHR
jgi:RNA-directed DNA polymerase